MLSISVTITGVKEQVDRMKNIVLGLQPHQIGEIINFVCATVARDAQAAAPVNTGRLRDSIVYYMNNEFSGEVAALAPYAMAVEYGYHKKSGKRVAGANFFRPAAMRGAKLLKQELLKYTIELTKGGKPKPPKAARSAGGRGSARGHKYLQKQLLGTSGKKKIYRYIYGKDSQTITSFRPLLKPSGRKQGGTKFRAFRGGARKR